MTRLQKVIKFIAIVLAVLLIVSIISAAATGLFAILGIAESRLGDMQEYTFSEDKIYSLDVDISSANFEIKSGNEFSVESNLKNLTVEVIDHTLIVKQKGISTFIGSGILLSTVNKEATLVLTIPKNTLFEEIDIDLGAGDFKVGILAAENLNISFGAGNAEIEKLTAKKSADIDGGAGNIFIKESTLAKLQLDMGVGKLDIKSKLSGGCELDLGVGEVNLTLVGKEKDYTVDIDKGIGAITVDGKVLSDDRITGSEWGENKVEINGGIGKVNINFD